MKTMRQAIFALSLIPAMLAAADGPATVLRGKLSIHEGKPPALETTEHRSIPLDGDETTRKVLGDPHLNGFEVEVKGHYDGAARFVIDPSGTHSLLARKDGHLKLITYLCDACNIHYATPGPCSCCQKETTIDLVDPDAKDR